MIFIKPLVLLREFKIRIELTMDFYMAVPTRTLEREKMVKRSVMFLCAAAHGAMLDESKTENKKHSLLRRILHHGSMSKLSCEDLLMGDKKCKHDKECECIKQMSKYNRKTYKFDKWEETCELSKCVEQRALLKKDGQWRQGFVKTCDFEACYPEVFNVDDDMHIKKLYMR